MAVTAPTNLNQTRGAGLMTRLHSLSMNKVWEHSKMPLAVVAGGVSGSFLTGLVSAKGWKMPWNLDVRFIGGAGFIAAGMLSKSKYADYYLAFGAGMVLAAVLEATNSVADKFEAWGTKVASWIGGEKAPEKAPEEEVKGYESGSIAGKQRRLQRLENRLNRLQGRKERLENKLGGAQQAPQARPALAPGMARIPARGGNVVIPRAEYDRLASLARMY